MPQATLQRRSDKQSPGRLTSQTDPAEAKAGPRQAREMSKIGPISSKRGLLRDVKMASCSKRSRYFRVKVMMAEKTQTSRVFLIRLAGKVGQLSKEGMGTHVKR